MEKRGISVLTVILILILVAIVIFSAMLFLNKPKVEPYSDDPKMWIEDKGSSIKEVNVEEVTKGNSYDDYIGQQLNTGNISTAFSYDGFYKGIYFQDYYADENNTYISISKDMKPRNGVIEGFIITNLEGNQIKVSIFVDQDWKDQIGKNTNILWGDRYKNIKEFEFIGISDGIYYDYILDDKDRFSEDFKERSGGVMVGDLDETNIQQENFDSITLIRQY